MKKINEKDSSKVMILYKFKNVSLFTIELKINKEI